MAKKKEIKKTRKKFWVLSKSGMMDQGGCIEVPYSSVLGICKTEAQARSLQDQDPEFRRASIDSVYLYE